MDETTKRNNSTRSSRSPSPMVRLFVLSLLFSASFAYQGSHRHHHHVHVHDHEHRSKPLPISQHSSSCASATTATGPAPVSMKRVPEEVILQQSDLRSSSSSSASSLRRGMLEQLISGIALGVGVVSYSSSSSSSSTTTAWASGGATAGRYTTIPIAKRRYYGRVQQAVHDFLLLGPAMVQGDTLAPLVQTFFDAQGVVVVAAKRQDISGQCTKKDGDCRGKEIRDSRYNDMKASMYLLGNAFRTDQQKPPDRLPTVKAAKAFFKEMNELEKIVKNSKPGNKNVGGDSAVATARYAAALDILDEYLDLVELPPTDSGHYDKEFDTLVGEMARIT